MAILTRSQPTQPEYHAGGTAVLHDAPRAAWLPRHRPDRGKLRESALLRQRGLGALPVLPAGLPHPGACERTPHALPRPTYALRDHARPRRPHIMLPNQHDPLRVVPLHHSNSRWHVIRTPTSTGTIRTAASSGSSRCTAGRAPPYSASVSLHDPRPASNAVTTTPPSPPPPPPPSPLPSPPHAPHNIGARTHRQAEASS